MTGKNIEIVKNYFLPPWVYALSFVVIISVFVFAYLEFYFLAAVSLFFALKVWFLRKIFEFNPATKQYRDGFLLSGFRWGEWKPLEISGNSHISFQSYNENVHYTYGGLFNQEVKDSIYEIRIIYPDLTFKTLVNGRDLQSVITMVRFGKLLSSIYNVKFIDHVKETISKKHLAE